MTATSKPGEQLGMDGITPCTQAALVGFAAQSCEAAVGPAAVQWPHRPEQGHHVAVPKGASTAKPAGHQGAANRPGHLDSDRKLILRLFILEEELLSSCSRTGQREQSEVTPLAWENCHGPIAPAVPPWPDLNCP